MWKVLLISGLFAFSAAAVIFSDQETDSGETQGCLYEDQIWGSADGTKFYFCIPDTGDVIEQSCKPNTFFVRNSTTCGCVPLDLVNPKCVNPVNVGPCTGANLKQPQPAANPSQFYVCPTENATPVLLNCVAGTAFIKQNGYMGCFQWTQWRAMRDCPE